MNANNAPALLRTLIIYAILVPLALVVGYVLTDLTNSNFTSASSLVAVGILAFILVFPLLVRWHYPLLLFCWSATLICFFVKTEPNVGQVMVAVSLGLSIVERIMNPQRNFIRVPSITMPLLVFLIVVLITAKINGGIGMHSFGSDVYGGRKYVILFIGMAGYFALTSRAIPPEKAKLYASLFLLGGITTVIGDLYPLAPSWSYIIFRFFPPSAGALQEGFDLGQTRLGGIGNAACAVYLFMLARYGLRGIFLGGKLWRPVALFVLVCLVLMGGFRTALFIVGLSFVFMFFAEGLYRTRMLGVFALAGILGAVIMVPFADKLPFTFQRAMSFLPVHISPEAQASADGSTEWRKAMWAALVPQIPQHLLVGKGYAISTEDYNEMMGGGWDLITSLIQANKVWPLPAITTTG